jgi:hypothetical protein
MLNLAERVVNTRQGVEEIKRYLSCECYEIHV